MTDPAGQSLRISVIVANHDYGHFLGACLESLRAQTSAADEIVVVDDGSTDGSRRLLEAETGITLICQENGGQAAAFNAGFAASTGGAVLFLDADDVLHPDAIATIRALWTGAAAGLFWSLDTIDAAGRRTGRYDMRVADLDMRPRLLDGLTLPFMPTSANVFARDAVAWAFPLPETRWRISADALLVRVAVFAGPMRPVARTLGGYRIHGGNNYHRGEEMRTANLHRGLGDIACAGLDLVALARRAGRLADDGERAKLLASAVRTCLRADAIAPDPKGLRAFLARLPDAAGGAGLRLGLLARLAALLLPRSALLRRWATEPALRPRLAQSLLETLAGARLAALRYAPVEARPPHDGPPANARAGEAPPLGDLLDNPAWERDWSDGSFRLRAARGGFTLRRPPGRAAELRLSLRPLGAAGPILRVSCNGLPLAVHHLVEATDLTLTLPPAPPGVWMPDRIEFDAEDPAHRRLRRHRLATGRLALTALALAPVPEQGPDLVLPVLGEAALPAPGEGGGRLGPGETLILATPDIPPPFALVLRCAEDQPAGRLLLAADGRQVFSGRVGPGARLVVDLPDALAPNSRIALAPAFRPDAFLDGPDLALAALGWLPGQAGGHSAARSIGPGERIGAGTSRALGAVLGADWETDETGGAVMTGPSAGLLLRPRLPGGTESLALDIAPLDPFAEEAPPVLLVTVAGAERARVRLAGRTTLDVTVTGADRTPDGCLDITLHAALPDDDGVPSADHGGIALHGLTLSPVTEPGPFLPRIGATPESAPLARHLARLRDAAATGFPAEDLPALRAALADTLAGTAPGAVWHLVTADDLGRLADLGARAGSGDTAPDAPPARGEGWLRDVARALLSGPPALAGLSLDAVPPLPAPLAGAVAALLVRDPGPGAPRETLIAYQSALVARLGEARSILAYAPLDSARHAFARAVVLATEPRCLLFSDLDLKPHATAFARALEAMLLRDGHVLDLPDRGLSRPIGRPRIGLLMRHAGPGPETWIARGLLNALPPGRADVAVFLTQDRDGPAEDLGSARIVPLAGRTVADAVAAIRAAELDTMVLCAAFHGAVTEAALAAHRLAPHQIALAAALPATAGFASIDAVLIGALEATNEGVGDYAEPVIRVPGTGQLFGFASEEAPDGDARARMRRRLGLGSDVVLVTSGAMADKIGDELLDAWTGILALGPAAVLVLYPFPASWQRDYDQAGFAARVRAACRAAGVDPARVIVLPSLGAAGVRDLLAAADLYLAAFPYSGATTTVEALRAGRPVIARAGRTQRGHQAAGWLEAFGQPDLVAATTEDYVRRAADLAASPRDREAASRAILEGAPQALAQQDLADWLGPFLLGEPSGSPTPHRYLFHHIPKTGGTSLRKILAGWFDVVQEYPEPWGHFPLDRIDLPTLGPERLIAGHYWAPEMPLFRRYPELAVAGEWRLVSMVRDPLEQALSEYFYDSRVRVELDPGFEPPTLDDFLADRHGFFLAHFDSAQTTISDVLDRYWFVGTLERFRDCVDWLADSLGKPRPDVLPVENATERGQDPSPEAVAAFMAHNAADYALYAEVNRRLDRLIGRAAD